MSSQIARTWQKFQEMMENQWPSPGSSTGVLRGTSRASPGIRAEGQELSDECGEHLAHSATSREWNSEGENRNKVRAVPRSG